MAKRKSKLKVDAAREGMVIQLGGKCMRSLQLEGSKLQNSGSILF
jgi:hypothetical protein